MPTGLVSTKPRVLHGADGASIAVTEVWDSKKDQEAFLADKLGAALAAGGAPAPTRNEWYTLLANNQLS